MLLQLALNSWTLAILLPQPPKEPVTQVHTTTRFWVFTGDRRLALAAS